MTDTAKAATIPTVSTSASGAETSVVEVPHIAGVGGKRGPTTPLWTYRDRSKATVVLGPHDTRTLEDVWEKSKKGTLSEQDEIVWIMQKTFRANIRTRQIEAVFWNESYNDLQRVTWYYSTGVVPGLGGKLPFSEADSAIIEEAYQARIVNELIPLTDPAKFFIFLVDEPGREKIAWASLLPKNGAFLWTKSGKAPPLAIMRQTEELSAEDIDFDQVLQTKPNHLVFVVHGIGEAFTQGETAFTILQATKNIANMNKEILRSHFFKKVDSSKIPIATFIPVQWHMAVHDEDITSQLRSIRLEAVPLLRDLAQDVISDVLFYLTPVHRRRILDQVVSQINESYKKFQEVHPGSDAKISILAHSLGSVISFDILANQPRISDSLVDRVSEFPILNPAFENLFAIGSPIGLFAVIKEGMGLNPGYRLPTTQAFFNIFHPQDPVAYRIEPIMNAKAAQISPELIPCHLGSVPIHKRIQENAQYVKETFQQASEVAEDLRKEVTTRVGGWFDSASTRFGWGKGAAKEPTQDVAAPSNTSSVLEKAPETKPDPIKPPLKTKLSFSKTQVEFALNNFRRIDYRLQVSLHSPCDMHHFLPSQISRS
eukprot:TRINITY_DN2324_c0_g1_i5.p1 TRINITY_DN2324_c0_g1~~TRINITY_DN2324_c0_g1_i5.p1  ORF type:complete len:598 (+),score=129.96 TRINITY_DN2324_c0_g1_i5:58-1851(+)